MKEKPRRTHPLCGRTHPLCGLIWTGIKGLSLSEEEKKNIKEWDISGLILFKRNIESLSQLFELCREIHSLEPAPLIMMDREGGSVDRLRHLSDFPSYPAPARLAELCSLEEIEKTAFYMAREMKALGICINFAPCVDVPSVSNPLFEGRLWGGFPEPISRKALFYFQGLKKAGVAACAKHFPGHGGVREDSHLQLPEDQRDRETLYRCDLLPFQKMIEAGVEMIMSAHVLYSKVDALMPATLSAVFLKEVLREKMGFQGLVVSDDLSMKALYSKNFSLPEVMVQALCAGVDVLLNCEPVWDIPAVIEEVQLRLSRKKTDTDEVGLKQDRIEQFRKKYGAVKPVSSFKQLKKIVACPKAHKWCKNLNERETKKIE